MNNFKNLIQNNSFGATAPMNNYVFQPIQPIQQPYMMQYNNGVQINSPYNYYMTPLQVLQAQEQQKMNFELKRKLAEESLQRPITIEPIANYNRFGNQQPSVGYDYEAIKAEEDWNNICNLMYYSNAQDKNQVYACANDRYNQYINDMNKETQELHGNKSMIEFLNDGLSQMMAKEWELANCQNNSRNLSRVYDSNNYNELLSMHKSSNPYVNELLNNAAYDNNIDDIELSNPPSSIYELIMRRKNRLQEPVPSIVSDAEVQMRRHAWTNGIINQIYNKGANNES